jgi:PAS domain S-box-containing protein
MEQPPAPETALVLVVESDRETGRFIGENLPEGCSIELALESREALRKALSLSPDLILCDVTMAGLSGEELVACVRSRPDLELTPIVILSAKTDNERRARLLREGAQDFLNKPFEPEELRVRVASLLRAKRDKEVLRRSEQRYHALIDVSAQIVWTADPCGRRVADSPSWRAFTGQTYDEMKGDGWLDAMHPEDRSSMEPAWKRAVRAKTCMKAEYRLFTGSGACRWMLMRAAPLLNEDGSVREWVAMMSDVTNAKHAEQAIINSERAQREFVANVSHDFRTPLAAIKGFAETLLSGALEEPRSRASFTRTILRNADRLARLVEDVLLLSSLETCAGAAKPRALDLALFLKEYAEEIRPLTLRFRSRLQIRVEPGTMIWADPHHLGKIIQNLVTNALKYNKRGGWVRVSASDHDGKVLVSVKDCGVGIGPEHLPRLFERFYRVDGSRAKETGDSGLGLNIVKRLVEMSGHTIWVNSAVGRGTTFHFTADRAGSGSGPAPVRPAG